MSKFIWLTYLVVICVRFTLLVGFRTIVIFELTLKQRKETTLKTLKTN